MKSFVIPSIFTAVNKFSAPVKGMTSTLNTFSKTAETGVARAERAFRKMTPAISEASQQMLSMVGTAALISAAFATGRFSVNAIMDYETAIASLSAITGTSGSELDKFKLKIKEVSIQTKTSSIEVANAFSMIGNNSPALLKDAAALAEVTKQSIILAQASKMELAPSADYLTKIMNQFNKPATEAKKVIDLLAGGMVIGSTDINKVSEAILIFGGAAGQANISLEESVTAIEAISDKVTDMSRLGTQFRNIFSRMEHASVLDKGAVQALKKAHVNMGLLESKTTPLIQKLKELKKLQTVKGGLVAVFNEENQQSLLPLLNSIDKYDAMLKKLTTSEDAQNAAQKMADKNNQTFSKSIEQLKNKFITWITTSDEAAKSLSILKTVVKFVTDNLSTIIKIVGLIVGAFITWWIWIKLSQGALIAYNVIMQAVFLVDMIKYVAATQGLTFAQAAWAVVVQSATGAMAGLNAIMLANPIGLIIIAIVVLIALVVVIIKKWNEWGAALSLLLGPLGLIIGAVQSFRRNWQMITEAFKTGGIIAGLKAIGATLLDVILMPLQQVFKLLSKLPSFLGGGIASDAMKTIESFRNKIGVNTTTDESGNPLPGKEAINPKSVQQNALAQSMTSTNNAKVDINIKDKNNRTDAYSDQSFVNIRTTSTMH